MIGSLVAKHNIHKAFEALNAKDMETFMSGWSDDGVFFYPGQLSVSGTFEGKAAVKQWFENFFRQFKKIDFRINHVCVENLFDIAGSNNVVAQWDIHLINKDDVQVHNVGMNLIKIRGRKVVEVRDFFFYMERLPIGWGESVAAP